MQETTGGPSGELRKKFQRLRVSNSNETLEEAGREHMQHCKTQLRKLPPCRELKVR
jgi:hypothetical protein